MTLVDIMIFVFCFAFWSFSSRIPLRERAIEFRLYRILFILSIISSEFSVLIELIECTKASRDSLDVLSVFVLSGSSME